MGSNARLDNLGIKLDNYLHRSTLHRLGKTKVLHMISVRSAYISLYIRKLNRKLPVWDWYQGNSSNLRVYRGLIN